ncbi:MAG TPA: oligosaccharide flippase family protein [Thermoleophilaceae bacterium]|nr:oligosaccharide flippase family protein [Thermoleophilaceae bacterium]
MGAGRLVNAGLGLVGVAIASRYLGVDAYGALVAGVALSGIVSVLTDLGIWNTGVREIAKRPEDAQGTLSALLTLGLCLSIFAAGIGALLAFIIYSSPHEELTRRAALLLMTTVVLSAPAGVISAYFTARQQAFLGMVGSVASSVFQLGGLVLADALGFSFTGVVLVYVAASSFQFLVMLALAAGKVRMVPSRDVRRVRRLVKDAAPLGGAMIVHNLYWRIDIVLLSVIATSTQVALYGISYKFVDALVVLPVFITVTLLPEFARTAVDQRERFQSIVAKSFGIMQVGTLAMAVLFVEFAKEIVSIVGGSSFDGAATVLQILMIGVTLTYLGSTFAQALVAAEKQKNLLRIALLLLPLNVALNAGLIPLWGAKGAATAFAATELLHFSALLFLYRKLAAIPLPERGPQVLLAAGLMAAVALLKPLLPTDSASPGVVLVVGGALSVTVYVAALYALHAMPRELHTHFVAPLYTRLRPKRAGV